MNILCDVLPLCPVDLTSWYHRITYETLPGFLSDFSPKLYDKVWNGKPGFEASVHVQCADNTVPKIIIVEEKE